MIDDINDDLSLKAEKDEGIERRRRKKKDGSFTC